MRESYPTSDPSEAIKPDESDDQFISQHGQLPTGPGIWIPEKPSRTNQYPDAEESPWWEE